jgi:hypothetical protein
MRILIILSLALSLLSSCGSLKKNLTRTREKEKTETTADIVATNTALATSTAVATRTIVEETEGSLDVSGSTITASGTSTGLDSGKVIRSETADQVIEVRKDPKTGRISATGTLKPQKINVHTKKITLENTATATSSATGGTTQIKTQTKTDRSVKDKKLVKSRDSGSSIFILGFVSALFLIVVILLIRWYLKRQIKIIP